MSQHVVPRARTSVPRGRSPAPLLAIGGVCGLAWAAGLRGFMADLAGYSSSVGWYGTFAQILLPGVIVGVLLAWAEHIRQTGGRRHWRWLAAAPIAFTLAVFVSPEVFEAVINGQPLLSGGVGGGAIAVPLFGMAGGYALSGRGPLWSRIAVGVVAVAAPIPAWAIVAPAAFGPEFALTTPRGAWLAVLYYSFMATLDLACTIPHRPVLPVASEAQSHSASNSRGRPTFNA